VRLDPTINVALADLQAQLDLQMKLREMQSAANSALRFLDSIEDQLKHTQTTAKNLNKEPDKEMMKALEDYVKQLDALEDRLARRSEGLGLPGKSRIVDRIGDLFFGIDGTNAAPTPYQRQYFQEMQPEYRERMAEVNRFINETVPQWNEKLRVWNLPTLTTRKPVDF
jgi:predicted nuclease with TOPRIM domain